MNTPNSNSPRKKSGTLSHGLTFHSLQEYVEVPLRHPWLVVVPLLTLFSLAVAASVVLPKRYRSSTLILVESEKVPDNFVAKMSTESMERRVKTMSQEVLSRTRLEQVIAEENPYGASDGTQGLLSAQVERMRNSIKIENKGTDAFVIEFVHTRPDKAASVANRLATLFINEAESERERQAVEGFEFISSQLAETRKALEGKEEAVRRFKEQNLGNLPEQLATNLSTLQRLQLEQQTLAENLRAAQARVDQLRHGNPVIPSTGAKADDIFTVLEQLRTQLAELRTRYTDQHPDVQALQRRIRELEAGRPSVPPPQSEPAVGASAELRRAEVELETLRSKRSDLENQMRQIQARVDSVPRTEQQLATMGRDYGQLQESYLGLLRKQMDARMAEQMERRWKGDRFKVLDPAHPPDSSYFPNRPVFALAGLVLGLTFGLGLAFAAEFLDHSVKSTEDLEELLPFPLLASIPRIDARRAHAHR
jgi:polysaccharide chain length determinant protein (PEP-CTERM system associated)